MYPSNTHSIQFDYLTVRYSEESCEVVDCHKMSHIIRCHQRLYSVPVKMVGEYFILLYCTVFYESKKKMFQV